MAGSTPFVLPQYQGSMYDLQRQQALANALMQGAMTPPQAPQAIGSGQYTVAPRMSAIQPLSNLAQGLMAHKIGQDAGQGMNNLGQQQWSALTNMLGGGAGGQSPQLSPDSANGGGVGGNAVANPFDGSDGGNGNAGAAGGPVNGVTAGPQLANNVGAQGGGSPLNPLGMNPGMAAMMMMQSPDKYWETQAAAYKPNDFALLLRQSGIDPTSAIGRQLMQAQVAKQNYLAPTSLRGQFYADQYGVHALPAPAPEGFEQVPNGQGGWKIQQQQGGLDALTASKAAGAIGNAYGQTGEGVDDTGNPAFYNKGALAAGTAGGAGGGFGQNNGRYPGNGGAAPGGIRPALSATDQAANTQVGTGAGKQYVADSNAANGYAGRMFTLNKALTALQNSDTGPKSDSVNGIKSFLLAQTPDALHNYLPGVDANKIASYDEAQKYLTQYAIGQAGALGEGTDSKLATTLSGNANTHISNLAAQDVVKANMGLERMRQAQIMQFNQTGQPASKYQTWSAQWNKQVDPRVFIWDSLDPGKRAAMAQGMNPQQRQAFTTQYNWALQNKFIDGGQ